MPERLTKGVNVPYIFGALEYYYLRGQVMSSPYNPFNANHMNNLLISADFEALRWVDYDWDSTYQEHAEPGFRHVRLLIDPYAVGANPDGSKNTSTYFNNCREALRNTIVEAAGQDVGVILCIDPKIISQAHADMLWEGGWKGSSTADCPEWPGPTRLSMATLPKPGQSTIPTDHPLLVFWDWFSNEIKGWSQTGNSLYSSYINPNYVFLEIMNEPLVDFNSISTEWGTSFTDNIRNAEADWWRIQKAAINVVHGTNRLPSFEVIATTYNSDPRDIKGWKERHSLADSNHAKTIAGGLYTYEDVEGYDKVVYTVHMYHPYRYTHTNWGIYTSDPYNAPPYQLANGDPDYYKQRDFLEENLLTSQTDPQHLGWPEDDNGQDSYGQAVKWMIQDMNSWINSADDFIPPMMITEFGAENRYFHPSHVLGDAAPIEGTNDSRHRADYYSDVRSAMETLGWGWTCFAQYGGFNIWNGEYSNANVNGQSDTRYTGERSWAANMREALFRGW